MSDPVAPPPRRPAPDRLRDRVLADLDGAPKHRVRPRQVILPVAAAAATAALVLGVSSLGGRAEIAPAETASPAPTTASTTGPPATAKASVDLNVRAMTRSEIATDTKACRAVSEGDTDPPPQRGTPKPIYAVVQRTAGVAGPSTKSVRMLITQDDAGVWVCESGRNTSWSADAMELPKPTAAVPAAEADSYGGGGSTCGVDAESSGTALFSVGRQVTVGRVRTVRGRFSGEWSTSAPVDGLVHFMFHVRGEDALAKNVSVEFQFLGANSRPVTVQPYGPRGTKTGTTVSMPLMTCADRPTFPIPKALSRPKSDQSGVASCVKMVDDRAREDGSNTGSTWRSRLVVSTTDEWGAVLSNGSRRVGCSLFPTREISPTTPDSTTIDRAAFLFALNPIAVPDGQSLWAAGRAPTDVTEISYRLPGGRDVAATISPDGYWMMKFHTNGRIGDFDVAEWDPVVVTVTRPSGRQTFTLPFGEDTMCHQVSHGC